MSEPVFTPVAYTVFARFGKEYKERIARGECFLIMLHGKPFAELKPATDTYIVRVETDTDGGGMRRTQH